MTQKQAIVNIISQIDYYPAKVQFLSNWLEDINWHTENARLKKLMAYKVVPYKRDENYGLTEGQKFAYKLASEAVRGLNYIYGWGTVAEGWRSGGAGNYFVDELIEIIEASEKEQV